MVENNNDTPKIETEYAAVIDSHLHIVEAGKEGEDYLTTAIGTGKKCVHKYQLIAEVPNIAKMAKEGRTLEDLSDWFIDARDAKLQDIVNMAVKNMFTRPAYDSVVDRKEELATTTEDPDNAENPFIDYPLITNEQGITGHEQMQTMLDDYRVGAKKAASISVKADAQAMKLARKQANELGFESFDHAMEALKKLKQA